MTRPPRSDARARRPLTVVGMGASAGGLEAFRRVLQALPEQTGMAYVLVQHLDPHHESLLPSLLSATTHMPVVAVNEDVHLEPDHVYVVPSARDLLFDDGIIRAVPRSEHDGPALPIDAFFRSLATSHGAHAIAVVLSGMGADGSLGLRRIAEAGGLVLVQDPSTARYADMPRNAIESGVADFVLPPEGIGAEIGRLGDHSYFTRAEPAGAPTSWPAPTIDETQLAEIVSIVSAAAGAEFRGYKSAMLLRRVARRMAVCHVDDVETYVTELRTRPEEAAALRDDWLISVTCFFRDPEVFDAVRDHVLVPMLRDRPLHAPLRLWVPACATGEEAYSLAMCALEAIGDRALAPQVQLFATDLGAAALAKARAGIYPGDIARSVSPERLRRFFTATGGHYQIQKAVREMCVFAQHDLTRDPPYSRMDLVSCRNLLIYLGPALQERVFANLHYALRPDGVLVLGPAETAGGFPELFTASDEAHRIYTRRSPPGPPRLLQLASSPTPPRLALPTTMAVPAPGAGAHADRILLSRYGPAAVIVDDALRIVEFRGDTDPYLEHAHGKASLGLLRMVRRGLLVEIRRAIEEVRRRRVPTQREGLHVRHRGATRTVRFEISPLAGENGGEPCLLIVFETQHLTQSVARGDADATVETQGELAQLSQRLAETTDHAHVIALEHERALEQLQVTNEEALSANEEMQSVNEELQTAKEEVQSANEELTTLNHELEERNAALARSNADYERALADANALVDTVRQPLLILDRDLRVERANASFFDVFRCAPEHTLGRLLSEIDLGRWDRPEIAAALRGALDRDEPVQHLRVDVDLAALGPRKLALDARRLGFGDGREPRLVVAIEDRTDAVREEEERAAILAVSDDARQSAEAADRLKDQFVATVSHELRGPLSVMSGWMNLLVEGVDGLDPAMLARGLASVRRAVAAQERLVGDLLDHSKLSLGKMKILREPTDLHVVASAALDAVRTAAAGKEIALRLTGRRAVSVVLGDADRLQQALWNLCFNAVKFTDKGGAVTVTVSRVGDRALVSVRDTGRGIAPELLPVVFERYRQAEAGSPFRQSGLGLGLALVREIVELHGGSVGAESGGLGQGATFTIALPIPAVLTMTLPDAARDPESLTRAAGSRRSVLDGLCVIVVGDDPAALEAVLSGLELFGARPRSASTVGAALAQMDEETPDLVITDLRIPGQDGVELLEAIRRRPPPSGGGVPCIALSGENERDPRLTSAPFQSRLRKPVALAELLAEVARVTGPDGN